MKLDPGCQIVLRFIDEFGTSVQMRSANRVKAPCVVIIGGDELAKGW